MSTVGDNIKRLRKSNIITIEKPMTLEQLGKLAGLSTAAMSQWEQGHADPNLCSLKKLAKALNVSIDQLVGE